MKFDNKIAVVVRNDLQTWQKLNVTAFTVSGIARTQDVMGEVYVDGSGVSYLPMIKQPIMVFCADEKKMKSIHQKALQREMDCTVYTEELFTTTHDEANRAAVKSVESDALNLVGIALYGPKNPVDKILKGCALHS